MVSTRQMATSSNNSAAAGSGNDETTRLSVVTRQSSSANSNNMGANCSTPSTSSAAAAAAAAAAASSTTARHSHLTQAVKIHGIGNNAAAATASASSGRQMHLLDLPIEILSKILSYTDYKRIGQLRVVSQKVNDVCMHILNSTFSKLITQTYNHFHAIKASMPRRESARRNHPLACECDIIETCYMRLSLLQMTIGKHIERGHCCFFPGAILDEVYIILNYIKNTPCLERPYRVTDELFDLSTMAMEYFRDRIEPTLPGIAYFNKDFFKLPTTTKRPALVIASDLSDNSNSLPSPPQSNMVLRKGIRKIKQGMKIYNNQLSVLRNELRTCKRKSAEQGKQIGEQQKLLAEQQKQTLEYANRLDENDKKNEEMARKFSTLLQELNKCKTELQYWRSKSPAMRSCVSCGQKVVPVLPTEDYQALINQGVKPEDIILSLDDDTGAESDANLTLSNDFVFPDETTTAKVLAINTATKNLKRQHHYQSHTNTASNSITNTSSNIISMNNANSGGNELQQHSIADSNTAVNIAVEGPTEMTQCLIYAKGDHVSTCAMPTVVAAAAAATTQPLYTNVKDFNSSNTPGKIENEYANLNSSLSVDGIGSGYATKLFYGTNVHKSVIVSPSRANEMSTEHRNATGIDEHVNENACGDNGGGGGGVANATTNTTVEDVVTLQAIKSHETKKARRVQKATRCASGSGSKRSK